MKRRLFFLDLLQPSPSRHDSSQTGQEGIPTKWTHSFFIIDQVKAELQYCRMHFNKPIIKTIRTISKENTREDNSVSSNLFGFSAVLLRRRLDLTVLSKEFLVTYELKHKNFEDLVSQLPIDIETTCQLLDFILRTSLLESYEGPNCSTYECTTSLWRVSWSWNLRSRYNKKERTFVDTFSA